MVEEYWRGPDCCGSRLVAGKPSAADGSGRADVESRSIRAAPAYTIVTVGTPQAMNEYRRRPLPGRSGCVLSGAHHLVPRPGYRLGIFRRFGEASFEPLKLTQLAGTARCPHQLGIFDRFGAILLSSAHWRAFSVRGAISGDKPHSFMLAYVRYRVIAH
jgi:hypothetical protein